MHTTKPFLTLTMLLVLGSARAQCTDQVTNTLGTAVVDGTDVTVTSAGVVDVNSVYCAETFPYFIGYGTGSGSAGSYTFAFNPAIASAMINVSGISQDANNAEEVRLFVNGAHYSIPAPGLPQTCDPMAVLTANGDIAACTNCSVSGWGGTPIPGPITTLTVQDTILLGAPAGAIFSLFICAHGETGLGSETEGSLGKPYPNPATDHITLHGIDARASVRLFDARGSRVPVNISNASGNLSIGLGAVPPGIYSLQVQSDAGTVVHRVVVR
ncbi:MAG: T9SS type A sorting domain-containing protein [Flavobacteriales bacterium]